MSAEAFRVLVGFRLVDEVVPVSLSAAQVRALLQHPDVIAYRSDEGPVFCITPPVEAVDTRPSWAEAAAQYG